MFTTAMFFWTLTCAPGADCTQASAVSPRPFANKVACERNAVTAAQMQFYVNGSQYTYRCEPVAFKPARD